MAALNCSFGLMLPRRSLVRGRPSGQVLRRNSNKLPRIRAMADSRDEGGEESPESLFMKELKRRGLSAKSASTETKTKQSEKSVKSSREWTKEQENQLKRSMALNSEGIDGLIPRATELLKLGTTFFLAFWPLIIALIVFTVAMYLYFGPSFVHPGNVTPARPTYVDPYQLLEEGENLSQDLGSSVR